MNRAQSDAARERVNARRTLDALRRVERGAYDRGVRATLARLTEPEAVRIVAEYLHDRADNTLTCETCEVSAQSALEAVAAALAPRG